MQSDLEAPKITIVSKDTKATLSLSCTSSTLSIYNAGKLKVSVSFEKVLWCAIAPDGVLSLSLLRPCRHKLVLLSVSGSFDAAVQQEAERFSTFVMEKAYEGLERQRKFKVLINPKGGPGKALQIFHNKARQIFDAAHCSLDVAVTNYGRHGYEIVKGMTLDYDAIVVFSGDGLIHEVFNGLADHDDSELAFNLPVIQIPTGSANGFSMALLGLKEGLDVGCAVLNAIKGKKMKIDLCSFRQNDKKSISFLTQTVGLIADLDLGTEGLRWMGDTRFVVGFIWEVMQNKGYGIKLEIKTSVRDKAELVKSFKSRNESSTSSDDAEETWITIDKPVGYMYAGKIPYVSKDLMQFPLALCDDGYIDVVVQDRISRLAFLKAMDGSEQGKQYWISSQHYYKARAYRLTPHGSEGHCSIDGERFPHVPFEVEVLPRLGTTLGRGSWAAVPFYDKQ